MNITDTITGIRYQIPLDFTRKYVVYAAILMEKVMKNVFEVENFNK